MKKYLNVINPIIWSFTFLLLVGTASTMYAMEISKKRKAEDTDIPQWSILNGKEQKKVIELEREAALKTNTPLILAIKNRDLKMVELLIKADRDPNQRGSTSRYISTTPLFSSLESSGEPLTEVMRDKILKIANILLEHGADPNLPNKQRFPCWCRDEPCPLRDRLRDEHPCWIRDRFRGAKPCRLRDEHCLCCNLSEECTAKTQYPLILACHYAGNDSKSYQQLGYCFVEMLLEKNANPNVSNIFGSFPLSKAIRWSPLVKPENRKLSDLTVEKLLKYGADPDIEVRMAFGSVTRTMPLVRPQEKRLSVVAACRKKKLPVTAKLEEAHEKKVKKAETVIFCLKKNYGNYFKDIAHQLIETMQRVDILTANTPTD